MTGHFFPFYNYYTICYPVCTARTQGVLLPKQEKVLFLMKDFAQNSCRVALVQAGPVMFDKAATVERALALIEEAAGQGAQLIVFPESFIPCYPYGMTFGFTVGARKEEAREDWLRYYNNPVVVPGPEAQLLGDATKKTGTYISIGITERDSVNATLYCTNLIFAPDGIWPPSTES